MPQFAFVAKDRMGNTVRGTVEAADQAFAANKVGQMGYALVELGPAAISSVDRTAALTSPPMTTTGPAVNVARTQEMAAAPFSSSLAGTPEPVSQKTSGAQAANLDGDILRADAAKRRKVEMDLARMGMKPAEIARLLDANASTTEAPPTSLLTTPASTASSNLSVPSPTLPAKGKGAQQKAAQRAADLHSYAAQLQSATAAKQVQAVEAVSLDLPEFRASSIQERQQAEAILRDVYALRRREKYAEALGKCREALSLVPSDAAALEMFGDLLQGVARTNEALAAYKRATEADPKRSSAERKYGDLLMRQQKWSEGDPEEVPKNPIVAAVFSLMIPGAGQIHNGEKLKGAALAACAAVSVAILLFLMRDKSAYSATWDKPPPKPAGTTREKRVAIDWIAEAPMISCILFYGVLGIGSAIDAASGARRTRRAV